jgi:hypothetical protein
MATMQPCFAHGAGVGELGAVSRSPWIRLKKPSLRGKVCGSVDCFLVVGDLRRGHIDLRVFGCRGGPWWWVVWAGWMGRYSQGEGGAGGGLAPQRDVSAVVGGDVFDDRQS